MNVQTNYCNNNLLILDVKQLKKIIKLNYFYILKALWKARVKLRCIMGCSGLKNSYQEKGLMVNKISISTFDFNKHLTIK